MLIFHQITFFEYSYNVNLTCYIFANDNSSNFCDTHLNAKLVSISELNVSRPITKLVKLDDVGFISKHFMGLTLF